MTGGDLAQIFITAACGAFTGAAIGILAVASLFKPAPGRNGQAAPPPTADR